MWTLLKWLLIGHVHKWEEKEIISTTNTDSTGKTRTTGKHVRLSCVKCGRQVVDTLICV